MGDVILFWNDTLLHGVIWANQNQCQNQKSEFSHTRIQFGDWCLNS